MGNNMVYNDFSIYGFYSPEGLSIEETGMLTPIFNMKGKYYIFYALNNSLSDLVMVIENIGNKHNKIKDEVKRFVSGGRSVIFPRVNYQNNLFLEQDAFGPVSIDVTRTSNIIKVEEIELIKPEVLRLSNNEYMGAVLLPDKKVIIGNKEFLEEQIVDNLGNTLERANLLEEVYSKYYQFDKLDKLINNVLDYLELDQEAKYEWQEKKKINDYCLYAMSLINNSTIKQISFTEETVKLKRV